MSEDRYTKEELIQLGQKALERRRKQADAQARRREKLKASGRITLTLTVPESRAAEIKKIVADLGDLPKGETVALFRMVDGGWKPATKAVTLEK